MPSTLKKRFDAAYIVTALVVTAVAAAMSAKSLVDLAVTTGYPPAVAWGLPVCVDGVALVATLAICSSATDRTSDTPESTVWPWVLLLTAVAVSVIGNAAYADGAFARGAHSIPPLAAAVVIHFLAQRLRRGIAKEALEAERAAQEAQQRAEQVAQEAAAEAARVLKEQERLHRAERLASQPAKPPKTRQTASQDDSEPRGDPKDPAVIAQVLAMRAVVPKASYRAISELLRIDKNAVMGIVKDNAESEVAA